MSRDVDSNHNVTFDCKYHVVFCPKYSRKVLVEPIDARVKALLSEKATDIQAEIVEMEMNTANRGVRGRKKKVRTFAHFLDSGGHEMVRSEVL